VKELWYTTEFKVPDEITVSYNINTGQGSHSFKMS